MIRRRLAGLDPGLTLLRLAAVVMAAVLGNFATALFVEHRAHLTANVVILGVALAFSLGRVGQRAEHRSGSARWLGLLVLPVVAIGANEIGTRMLLHPNVGDPLFALAMTATIWVRRFGPAVRKIATLATLPLVAMLVVPAPVISAGGSIADGRWWSALVAVSALVWTRAVMLVAEQTGFLPRPAAPPSLADGGARSAAPKRVAASTKMALQMGVALGAAFVVGRNVFGTHWTWVVLTAFIVCSGNRGREDVAGKAVMRVLGAGAGTLAATVLAGAFPAGDPWAIVAIFAVLAVATCLRPLNYAYWAGGMTAALALLYGYFGEGGAGLLGDRLGAIVVGAVLALAASWFLLPVRTTDVLRRDLARALAALVDYLAVAGAEPGAGANPGETATGAMRADPGETAAGAMRAEPTAGAEPGEPADPVAGAKRADPAEPTAGAEPGGRRPGEHQLPALHARFTHAVSVLDQAGGPLRRIPRRLRSGPDYLPALPALRRAAGALPSIAEPGRAGGPDAHAHVTGMANRLRRCIRDQSQPDEDAWEHLADALCALSAVPSQEELA